MRMVKVAVVLIVASGFLTPKLFAAGGDTLGFSIGGMGSYYRNITIAGPTYWTPTVTAELVWRTDKGEVGVFADNTLLIPASGSIQQLWFFGFLFRGFVANKSKGGPTIAVKFDPTTFLLLALYSGALTSRPIWDYFTGLGFEIGYRPASKMVSIQPFLGVRYFYWPYPSLFGSTWGAFLTNTQRQVTLDVGLRVSI